MDTTTPTITAAQPGVMQLPTPPSNDGGCPMNGGADSCPADQATINRCNAC
jgi:hypothetical protein